MGTLHAYATAMATIRPGVLELNPREFARILAEDAANTVEIDRLRSENARITQLARRCGERSTELLGDLVLTQATVRRLHYMLGRLLEPDASVEDWANAEALHSATRGHP